MRGASAVFAAIGLAIVITALTLKDRQTPAVINAFATGASRLVESSLGQMPALA
jgi:hypothetical protein